MITKDVLKAKEILENRGLVAIPTETVYGLAANAYDEKAVAGIFELKKRPAYNPLIVHIKSVDVLQEVASQIPPIAMMLAKAFWPGPLTLVLKKHPRIPDIVTAGKETVGIRIPNHPLTLELLGKLDFPLAAPSANPFGSISPTTAQHVYGYFGETLPFVLDGGECEKGLESTIIGFEGDQAVLYRHGAIAIEAIEKVAGPLKRITTNDTSPEAPGMLSRHYAPRTKTLLSDNVDMHLSQFSGKKIALLLYKKPVMDYTVDAIEILSPSGDLEEAGKNLYAAMHRLDQLKVDVIIAERLPDTGIGRTLNDRLQRAIKDK